MDLDEAEDLYEELAAMARVFMGMTIALGALVGGAVVGVGWGLVRRFRC